ncbi:DUF975 family protein [Periweissella ghanensis]|uniref:DUF975 family protein n=1 Tax=Periweissella ghanensis TaxID=467997 RepID=A0ABN8BPZ7_9LACO|nr:DUF975 family protein [Periweissella ghanensis]MCM0601621.1 DUF975 family protein [Periweissella ghanensis]CAH0418698.1 hypothetical protein WGH24286_01129 [Periweissella ghanensis]
MQTMTIGDYKRQARQKLAGNWPTAVRLNAFPAALQFISTIVSVFLIIGVIIVIALALGDAHASNEINQAVKTSMDASDSINLQPGFLGSYGNRLSSFLMSIVIAMVSTGIYWASLDWLRGKKATVKFIDAFEGFNSNNILANFMLLLVMTLFKILWTCVLIIPGCIKVFSYSQTMFIYKDMVDKHGRENVPTSWTWYITASRRLMQGHKAQLFWLEVSFIGWYVLVALTFGIAWFWVLPYVNMTRAVFYDNLAGDAFK